MQDLPVISESGWLDKLPDQLQQSIRDEMLPIELEAGQRLYNIDEDPKGIYQIEEGQIKLSAFDPQGRETTLSVYEPPRTIGEGTLISGYPHPYSATATKKSRVRLLPKDRFHQLRKEHPEMNENLLKLLGIRLAWMYRVSRDSSYMGLEARLANRLHNLIFATGINAETLPGGGLSFELNQYDLATMLGTTKQSINKILKHWETLGLVELKYGGLVIKDMPTLLEVARHNTAD